MSAIRAALRRRCCWAPCRSWPWNWLAPVIHAFGITGSTGSGRAPIATTRAHPLRHSNMYAYKPLTHRHGPEVAGITEAVTRVRPELRFTPHSGPFARGIHMTLQATLKQTVSADELRHKLTRFLCRQALRRSGGWHSADQGRGRQQLRAHRGRRGRLHRGCVYCHRQPDEGRGRGAVQWMNRLLGWTKRRA